MYISKFNQICCLCRGKSIEACFDLINYFYNYPFPTKMSDLSFLFIKGFMNVILGDVLLTTKKYTLKSEL